MRIRQEDSEKNLCKAQITKVKQILSDKRDRNITDIVYLCIMITIFMYIHICICVCLKDEIEVSDKKIFNLDTFTAIMYVVLV